MSAIVSATRVRELLSYDPDTGVFTWIVSRGTAKKGNVAGTLGDQGYTLIAIDSRKYKAHRLVFLYVNDRFPDDEVDHINSVRHDNRLSNLRVVTRAENQQNRRKARRGGRSGLLGVAWHAQAHKWEAQIGINSKRLYLGLFPTAELAHAAYLSAKRELHPTCTI